MAIVCPTVLAATKEEYDEQIRRVSFAPRVQIDFMDGEFVETKSIEVKEAWWPDNIKVDLHLMYIRPDKELADILRLKPNLVIVHAEADIDHLNFAGELHKADIKAGLCVLPDTQIRDISRFLKSFDHLLIFGGHLGHFGGNADLKQLKKAEEAKKYNPNIEIGWDGGVNDQIARELAGAGIEVMNAGGFIQKAESPEAAYAKLVSLVE